jgi:hypothetical protein
LEIHNQPKETPVKKSSGLLLPIFLIFLISLACTITIGAPTEFSQQDLMNTAVAMTLAVGNPQNPTFTPSPQATATRPAQPPTLTPLPCNKALSISETYPDNTVLSPNANFVKSWRLQNIGTCTWNPNYRIVFSSGDLMSANAVINFTFTGTPGEIRDININMKAPAAAGTYKGIWKLQGDDSQFFGTVWVQIIVQPAAPPAPVSHTVTLTAISIEGGSIRSDGSVNAALPNVGDNSSNVSSQVFASFDMTVIPAGAIIQQVKLTFSGYDTLGNPFGGLGCLRMYQQDYSILDAGDYFGGAPLGALARWCAVGELAAVYSGESSFASQVQLKVGSNRFQARFQFNEHATNSDGIADMVRFGVNNMEVTYYNP